MSDLYEQFMTRIKNNGLAKTNNFFARITVNPFASPLPYDPENPGRFFPSDQGTNKDNMFPLERLRTMSLMCKDASLPKRDIKAVDFVSKPGYVDKIASYQEYEQTMSLSFYCSPDLNERRFFENWANLVIDPYTKQPNYYDEYAKTNMITVFVLPRHFSGTIVDESTRDMHGNQLYYVKFYECYPISITENELSTSSTDLLELEVTISYKYFRTIADDNFPRVS